VSYPITEVTAAQQRIAYECSVIAPEFSEGVIPGMRALGAGWMLNGTESTDDTASQTAVRYLADVTVTGTRTGYLKADATINAFQQSLTGFITSSVDGDVQTLGSDPSVVGRLLNARTGNPPLATVVQVAAAAGLKFALIPVSAEERA
jgi:hypothetical protein